ncbi:MAG: hypothetical protein ACK5N8_08510 [Alphaproteobacteria bacterium]
MRKKSVYSSDTYKLSVEDLLKLKKAHDYEEQDEVVVFLGNPKHNEDDVLLSGYETLKKAHAEGIFYVQTKLAYRNYRFLSGFFVNLLKFVKRNNYQEGRHIYRMDFDSIMENDVLRGERNLENAYSLSSNVEIPETEDRRKEFMKLYDAIKENGYDIGFPMIILLNRKLGIKDQVLQGHHRAGICKELGVKEISVVFWGAPRSLGFMMLIYRILRLFRK